MFKKYISFIVFILIFTKFSLISQNAQTSSEAQQKLQIPDSKNSENSSYKIKIEPIVKSSLPVKNLDCVPTSSNSDPLFAYSEGNLILMRNLETNQILHNLPFDNISSFFTAIEGEKIVVLANSENTVSYWELPHKKTENLRSASDLSKDLVLKPNFTTSSKEKKITAIAFSKNSDNIAIAYDDATISLLFKLRYIQNFIATEGSRSNIATGHVKTIYSLGFSPDGNYLIISSLDGWASVWKQGATEYTCEVPFYAEARVPALFSDDGQFIFCTTSKTKISKFSLSEKEENSLDLAEVIKNSSSEIVNMKVISSNSTLAVQTSDNLVHLFDQKNLEYLGFLPRLNNSTLTSFDLDGKTKYVFLGYEDGSLYKINFEENLLKPNAKIPEIASENQFSLSSENSEIQSENVAKNQPEISSNSENGNDSTQTENSAQNSQTVSENKINTVDLGLGLALLNFDYSHAIFIGGTYKHFPKKFPFYVGGGANFSYGFPKDDYSYTFVKNGKKYEPPILIQSGIYVPFGYKIYSSDTKISLFAECRFGAKFSMLKDKNENIKSKVEFSPYLGVFCGITAFNIILSIGCEYDTIVDFTPRISLGYSINLGKKSKVKTEKTKSEAEVQK